MTEDEICMAAIDPSRFKKELFDAVIGLDAKIEKDASLTGDSFKICIEYYRIQSMHDLGTEGDIKTVSICLSTHLGPEWTDCFSKSIEEITTAAPGLRFHITKRRKGTTAFVQLVGGGEAHTAYTTGNIFKKPCVISVGSLRNDKEQTSTHELLHVLGFFHEMKRKSAHLDVLFNESVITSNTFLTNEQKTTIVKQYSTGDKYHGITRFDPFSIMCYQESKILQRRPNTDPVWDIKKLDYKATVMSELDKVALNLMFRPCKSGRYDPKLSDETGLLYCGRTLSCLNYPTLGMIESNVCGPKTGPNCPACRVIRHPISEKRQRLHDEGKWQGWSGWFYCGQENEDVNDRTCEILKTFIIEPKLCGPDNGPPCNKCGKELDPLYDCKKFILKLYEKTLSNS